MEGLGFRYWHSARLKTRLQEPSLDDSTDSPHLDGCRLPGLPQRAAIVEAKSGAVQLLRGRLRARPPALG